MNTPEQKTELNAAPESAAADTSNIQGEPAVPAMTPKQETDAFTEAKARAEGIRQTAMLAARRAFDAAGAPAGQRAYDAAVRAIEVAYYESVVGAAERFGIHAGSYRVALANLRCRGATQMPSTSPADASS